MDKLYFTMEEMCYSDTAIRNKIDNTHPNITVCTYMMELIYYVLNPLRVKLGKPVIINSGYRCSLLNSKIGGVGNSQHLLGQAADIRVDGMTTDKLIDFIIKSGIEYDQLLHEGTWVHISFRKGKNRKQYLKLA